MALILLCLAACAAGVGLTLYADATQRPRLEWIGKPLAALAFILAGTLWGALDSSYGQWILAGLVLGALGDVLLIPRSTGLIFMGGMLAFG
ncbi:MAG: lysoplasmalogenase family protein, partial [Oceanococcaceae bacterium]